MSYNLDPKKNKLVYLYQLRKERCMQSFGINVAQIAGLPHSIIEKSKAKAEVLHEHLVEVYQRCYLS
jgi:DNA mismatch repair ATPase MutS